MAIPQPLIGRLDAAIADCRDAAARECLKAERAAALARMGAMDEARFVLTGLKTQQGRLRSPRLACWIAFVEGMLDRFSGGLDLAQQCFERVVAAAREHDDREMQALALAWLASIAANRRDLVALLACTGQAFALSAHEAHGVRARLALTLAAEWHYAGDEAHAQRWFQTAREHANGYGETTLISIGLFNRTVERCAALALEDAFGAVDPVLARQLLLQAESTANLDVGLGASSLPGYIPRLRAELLSVLGESQVALELYDAHAAPPVDGGHNHLQARREADRAWCLWRCGREAEALTVAARAQSMLGTLGDADELAFAHARLARLLAADGQEQASAAHQRSADTALQQFRQLQAQSKAALQAAGY